jgi:hypothetical protein
MCLFRFGTERSLRLSTWNEGWDSVWRFLGVQEVSDT